MKQVPLFYMRVKPWNGMPYIVGDLDGYYRTIKKAQAYKKLVGYDVTVEPMFVYDEVTDEQFAKKYLPYELDKTWDEPKQKWVSLSVHESTSF